MTEARVTAKISARVRDLDGHIQVRRVLPAPRQRAVGPFVFLDQMGPVPFEPGRGMDVRPHPHIGLATVTYLYEGAIVHRDSLGYDQVIRPGDVNWMTAGAGIVHSERTERSLRAQGGSLFGVQAWVALPRDHEEQDPSFVHHPAATVPSVEAPGHQIRIIAGALEGRSSPVRFPGELTYLDIRAEPQARIRRSAPHPEMAIYVASGAVEIGGDRFDMGDLAVLGAGLIDVTSLARSRLLVFGGPPLDGPRHMFWNFVSSRPERIEKAKDDWRRGRFDPVPGETDHVPLPE